MENSNSVQDIERLIYAIAHDLKTPVTNMINLFSLLNRTKDQESRDKILNKIQASAYQLDESLSGFMEMVNIDNDESVQFELVDFSELWSAVETETSQDISEYTPEFNVNFSEAPSIRYPKSYIRSIFLNLLTNSLKYRHPDKNPRISISTESLDERIRLTYKDNGIGIDLEKYGSEIFKPFKRFTTEGSGKGIGLNLIHQMVKKFGGTIDIQSKPMEGTTFYIILVPQGSRNP